jgi:hypothetical protein
MKNYKRYKKAARDREYSLLLSDVDRFRRLAFRVVQNVSGSVGIPCGKLGSAGEDARRGFCMDSSKVGLDVFEAARIRGRRYAENWPAKRARAVRRYYLLETRGRDFARQARCGR